MHRRSIACPFLLIATLSVLAASASMPMDGPALFDGNALGQEASDASENPMFTNVSEASGLSGLTGNFFSWGDVDGDGHQDLLIDGKRLMRNQGPPDYSFEEITGSGMASSRSNSGVFADFDNDGSLDIFCGGGAGSSDHPTYPDILWKNTGSGLFVDVTDQYGELSDTFPTVAAGWADTDRNGYVDLYMVNYENGTYQGYPDHFWLNFGEAGFVNSTRSHGMDESEQPFQGRGVSWGDFDNDGFQDAYVSNYRIMRNYLYRNMGGERFKESAVELGVEGHGNDHPVTREGPYYGHSLGSSWGDLDNDGDLDLWVTNLAHKDPWRGPICDDSYLFENMGEEGNWRFTDRREGSGIEVKSIPGSLGGGDELMVSSSMSDYDNDGDLDLFVPQIYGDVAYAYSYLYRNEGGFRFTEVGEEEGIRVWNTYGSAWCDYNEDGWPDLVTGGGYWDQDSSLATGYMVHLYRNEGGKRASGNRYLEVSLEGSSSNRAAIGARITAIVDRDGDGGPDSRMIREVQGGQGAHGQQDSMVVHFGVGGPVSAVDLQVRWPLGRTSMYNDIELDSIIRMVEPDDPVTLSIEIREAAPEEGGLPVPIDVGNTCLHTLDMVTLNLSHTREGTVISKELAIEGAVLPGEVRYLNAYLEGASWEEGDVIRVSVERSFPPLTESGTAELVRTLPPNIPPVAVLEVVGSSEVGAVVSFSGLGSYDQDGWIVDHAFDPGDGSDILKSPSPEVSHIYEEAGSYMVTLSVTDDRGGPSIEPAVQRIEIMEASDRRPEARVLRVSPETSMVGEEVLFEGEGVPAPGTTITSYEWRSSIDGPLSTERSFTAASLSAGSHDISLTVEASNGLWSVPDVVSVEVLDITKPEVFVLILEPEDGHVFEEVVRIKGTAGPVELVHRVEFRIDGGEWTGTRTHPDWYIMVEVGELEEGFHILEARALSGDDISSIANISFRTVRRTEEGRSGTERPSGKGLGWVFIAGACVIAIGVASYFFYLLSKRALKERSTGEGPLEALVINGEGMERI